MLKSIFKIWWLMLMKICSGQPSISPELICKLPAQVKESSGLWIEHSNLFWTLSDSGGEPVLYAIDSAGILQRKVRIENAYNKDWESLAYDTSGHIYIGDFGNNNQNRKNLRIYKVKLDGLKDTLFAEVIEFSYPDQKIFPGNGNFDMEGFFFFSDSLYLFSKNKLKGGTGYSKILRLPAYAGSFTAELIDSVHTKTPVTGADINSSGNEVLLLSYGRIIRITDFQGTKFSDGNIAYWEIPFSQTEAIHFLTDKTVYFTNEAGRLYRFKYETVNSAFYQTSKGGDYSVVIYPNPASENIRVILPEGITSKTILSIINSNGQKVLSMIISDKIIELPVQHLENGIYHYHLITNDIYWSGSFCVN